MRLLQATTHNLVEPAGAIALAGLRRRRGVNRDQPVLPDRRGPAAVILTGGNVDAATLRTVLAGGTPTC
jgi:threonine dehydratase